MAGFQMSTEGCLVKRSGSTMVHDPEIKAPLGDISRQVVDRRPETGISFGFPTTVS
jgi:hypothetical protein